MVIIDHQQYFHKNPCKNMHTRIIMKNLFVVNYFLSSFHLFLWISVRLTNLNTFAPAILDFFLVSNAFYRNNLLATRSRCKEAKNYFQVWPRHPSPAKGLYGFPLNPFPDLRRGVDNLGPLSLSLYLKEKGQNEWIKTCMIIKAPPE